MKALALLSFLCVAGARFWLSWLNLRYLRRHGQVVPALLASEIDGARLMRINAYTAARARLGLIQSALSSLLIGAFLFAGGLAWYDALIARSVHSFVWSGAAFFVGLQLAGALLSVPLQLYSDFGLEAQHGFNRQTKGLWWSDWVKSTGLSVLISLLVSVAALSLVQAAPKTWWLWVSALICAFSLLLTVLAPYLIEPLFHRMEPLDSPALRDGIRRMTERAGVHVGRVLKVDASRRSAHSNAYFTGLGSQKRVVLYDTLLSQMSEPQILAILAHELGHWKKHHVLVRMLVMQFVTVLALYLASRLVPSELLPALVGMGSASFAARITILFALGSLLLFPLTPLLSAWSRHDERAADRFAVDLHGEPRDLADALAKLGSENLSNLHPHPWYAAFYYSHPPLTERVANLRALAQ